MTQGARLSKKGPMPEANTFEEKFEILLKIYRK